jgi:hypothetical protein
MKKKTSNKKKPLLDEDSKFEPVLIPPSPCYKCHRIQDIAFGLDTKEVSPGALSICDNCGAMTVCLDDLTTEPVTEEDLLPLKEENEELYNLIMFYSRIFAQRRQAPNN